MPEKNWSRKIRREVVKGEIWVRDNSMGGRGGGRSGENIEGGSRGEFGGGRGGCGGGGRGRGRGWISNRNQIKKKSPISFTDLTQAH